MASNLRLSTPANLQYQLDTSMPDKQILCSAVLAVAAGTSPAIFTLPAGSNSVVPTDLLVFNKTAVTGANTIQLNVNGVVQIPATAQASLAAGGVSYIAPSTLAATAIPLASNQTITVTQAVGTAGTIVVQVLGMILPLL